MLQKRIRFDAIWNRLRTGIPIESNPRGLITLLHVSRHSHSPRSPAALATPHVVAILDNGTYRYLARATLPSLFRIGRYNPRGKWYKRFSRVEGQSVLTVIAIGMYVCYTGGDLRVNPIRIIVRLPRVSCLSFIVLSPMKSKAIKQRFRNTKVYRRNKTFSNSVSVVVLDVLANFVASLSLKWLNPV